MTSIRESIRRLLGRAEEKGEDAPRPRYSYRIYWTKMVREWSAERRHVISNKLAQVLAQEDFDANLFERRYQVAGLDESKHAGASLLALREVLEGFDQYETNQQEEAT